MWHERMMTNFKLLHARASCVEYSIHSTYPIKLTETSVTAVSRVGFAPRPPSRTWWPRATDGGTRIYSYAHTGTRKETMIRFQTEFASPADEMLTPPPPNTHTRTHTHTHTSAIMHILYNQHCLGRTIASGILLCACFDNRPWPHLVPSKERGRSVHLDN